MIIRLMREEEADTVAALWELLVRYHQQLDPAMPQPLPDGRVRYAHRMRDSVHDAYAQTLVAELDGRIVGYITAMIYDLMPDVFVAELAGMVGDIFVLDAMRGRGVGRALVEAVETWFRLRGVRYYEWYTATANHDGLAFWQQVGGRSLMQRMRKTLL